MSPANKMVSNGWSFFENVRSILKSKINLYIGYSKDIDGYLDNFEQILNAGVTNRKDRKRLV